MNPGLYRLYRQWIAGQGPWGRLARGLLRLASWIYGLGVVGRFSLYRIGVLRQHRLSTQVISVGNLTAGGTGKTPFVILLVQEVKQRGLQTAVVVRGYGGRREGRTVVVSDGETIRMGYPEVGDEALLLARKLPGVPVLMAADRVRGCEVAVREFGAEVVLLDDGFQHLRVERNLDILLLEQENPFGYGYLLPRGLLREPVGGLRRADLFVITRAGSSGESVDSLGPLRQARPVPILEAVYTPTGFTNLTTGEAVTADLLRDQKLIAFCGIANPPGFERTLGSLGVFPKRYLIFADHHPYEVSDLREIAQSMGEAGATVSLTTEKDAIRLERLLPPFPVVMLRVKLTLTAGREELKRCLDALFP
ncbi:MAG: tetraacyldisaccharide 4'-kinase [Candidatus Methylomirabilales bacterium]